MSGIVNRLLDEARAGKHGPHVVAQYNSLEEATKSERISPWQTSNATEPADTRAVAFASLGNNGATEKVESLPNTTPGTSPKPDIKLCKNGHPLDDRGRCFGKGCKYN